MILITAYLGTISKTFMENKDLQEMIFLSLHTQTCNFSISELQILKEQVILKQNHTDRYIVDKSY